MPDINDPVLDPVNQRPAPGPLEEAMNHANVVALMRVMKPAARLEIMNQFCKHCGGDNPRCHCWNDE